MYEVKTSTLLEVIIGLSMASNSDIDASVADICPLQAIKALVIIFQLSGNILHYLFEMGLLSQQINKINDEQTPLQNKWFLNYYDQ